jgi:23S rRNA (cytosine1962-C5)-methyltransferase
MKDEYELLDLDEGRKLERFGSVSTVRPAPGAHGPPAIPLGAWDGATAEFLAEGKSGSWRRAEELPEPWIVACGGFEYILRATPSGQVGLFPEQVPWRERVAAEVGPGTKLLNLFAYTGGTTLAAARAGAEVTHVDSARGVVGWARANAERNGLAEAPIRWIVDDAARFVQREARRGTKYDAIVLDPPSFGRGPKGEIWKIEKNLGPLLRDCAQVLSASPRFVLVTAHTRTWKPRDLGGHVERALVGRPGKVQTGPLELRSTSEGVLRSGVYAWRALHG